MSVQKQIGELDQQPKPADGCARRRHRKDIHAEAAAKILLVKSHAPGSPATTIFNLELDRETRESAPVAAAAELRCCRSAGPLPLLEGSGP
jgi:hypothetical protein